MHQPLLLDRFCLLPKKQFVDIDPPQYRVIADPAFKDGRAEVKILADKVLTADVTVRLTLDENSTISSRLLSYEKTTILPKGDVWASIPVAYDVDGADFGELSATFHLTVDGDVFTSDFTITDEKVNYHGEWSIVKAGKNPE